MMSVQLRDYFAVIAVVVLSGGTILTYPVQKSKWGVYHQSVFFVLSTPCAGADTSLFCEVSL